MQRNRLIRIQLAVLVLLAGLLIWRGRPEADVPDGDVVLAELDEGRLYRVGMQVREESRLTISMSGAYETDDDGAPLAAYGWILDSSTRTPLWRPGMSDLTRSGVQAFVVDTIHVAPGNYDVFYTTVGPDDRSRRNAPFLGLTPYWTNDHSKWNMIISGSPPVRAVPGDGPSAAGSDSRSTNSGLLWSGLDPSDRSSRRELLFRVVNPTELSIYSIGSLCSGTCDTGWIEDARTGAIIWKMNRENTDYAGGSSENRVFSGLVSINPGVYRAVHEKRRKRSSWQANPPFDPDGWGLEIYTTQKGSVEVIDPWENMTPVIDMTRVGDDELRKVQFSLSRSETVIISAMGEISTNGSEFDYAWLDNNQSGKTVWKMTEEGSEPAGGSDMNRSETTLLDLSPGLYTVYFKSDGSHSYESWNKSKPDNPERWGVVLFLLAADSLDLESFSIIDPSSGSGEASPRTPMDIPEQAAEARSEELVRLGPVGNDADLSRSFELPDTSFIRIVAQGELTNGGRYDYGWLEDTASGVRVWEMTLVNTVQAGGEDRNRRFQGIISLPPGNYTVHYVSDFSHAYGDFGDSAPTYPDEWGIRIFKLVQ